MAMKISVEKVNNGYIVSEDKTFAGRTEVFKELADVFGELLMRFEGRCENFVGDCYGQVAVFRTKPKDGA